jgi:hypothetical protein
MPTQAMSHCRRGAEKKGEKEVNLSAKIRGRPIHGLPHVNLRRTEKAKKDEVKASQYFYFVSTPKLNQNQHHHHSQEIRLHTSKRNIRLSVVKLFIYLSLC